MLELHSHQRGSWAEGYHRDVLGNLGFLGYYFRAHKRKRKGVPGEVSVFRDLLYSDNMQRVHTSPSWRSLPRKLAPTMGGQRREGYSPHMMAKNNEVQRAHPTTGGRTRAQTTTACLPRPLPLPHVVNLRAAMLQIPKPAKV